MRAEVDTLNALPLGVMTADQIEGLLRYLPPAALRELARGPRAEPECRLCDTLSTLYSIGLLPEGSEEWDAAFALLDYHELNRDALDAIRMTAVLSGLKPHHPIHTYIGDLVGTMLFHRCQLIYAIAGQLAQRED